MPDLQLRRRFRPLHGPLPRLRIAVRAVEIGKPRNRFADFRRRNPLRPIEGFLLGVIHVDVELARATRPDLALAVAIRRFCL